MKRLLLTGLLLLGVGQVASFAQTDDIYFNSADIEQQKKEDKKRAEEEARLRAQEEENQYSSSQQNGSESGDYQTYNKSYDSDGYSEYNGDDYYYSSRIRRFNYPFYNMGYYSAFHNPYWYDPFWYDPYWGWSAWNRPGFSMSFGVGPYWSSYGGWYSWYGYGAFNSFWNYPYYAYPYGSYYSGYWNGYYAGLHNDNSYGGGRTVTYGPRNSTTVLNSTRNRGAVGLKPGAVNANPRTGLRTAPAANTAQPVRGNAVNGRTVSEDRPAGRRAVDGRTAEANEEMTNSRGGVATDRGMDDSRPVRRRFSQSEAQPSFQDRQPETGNNGRNMYQQPRQEAQPASPRQQQMQPQRQQRFQQRSEPRYETPRVQPRYEAPRSQPAPRMSSPSPAPSRGGGSFNSGGRGGMRR